MFFQVYYFKKGRWALWVLRHHPGVEQLVPAVRQLAAETEGQQLALICLIR